MDPGQDPISPEGEGGRTKRHGGRNRKGLDGQGGNRREGMREVGNQSGKERGENGR